MKRDLFAELTAQVETNDALRIPQREAFQVVREYFQSMSSEREIGLILPVGCGKSGLLELIPFAVGAKRALLIAPNLDIADQLLCDLRPSSPNYFYIKRGVLEDEPYPQAAELRSRSTNFSDLDAADIVVTNIHQLQGEDNRWMANFSSDYFDLIMFDEGHHATASSWNVLREKFPRAMIVNASATPLRADGRRMPGKVLYSYPIIEAVKNGYVKRLIGHRLNPTTLSYVRGDNEEVEISLEEVRALGEEDAGFRRSIVSSDETLSTIVDASIRKLYELRERSGERRLKIIASALNMEHCIQISSKYQERGLNAAYVHSRADSVSNKRTKERLENHELDVIVQVRKLGEGFDHPHLAVAAVFSIFSNLSPFMQFVGRIMRIIPGHSASAPVNEGVVVFHAGGNVTGVWSDFQEFAEADQEWLGRLVDDFIDPNIREEETNPIGDRPSSPIHIPPITRQGDVLLEDIALLDNPEVKAAVRTLQRKGVTTDQITRLMKIPVDKQLARRSRRDLLRARTETKTGELLAMSSLSPVGRTLDRTRDNYEVVKSAIDNKINALVGRKARERDQFTHEDFDRIDAEFLALIDQVRIELFGD